MGSEFTVVVVDDEDCPDCGGGPEWHNRPKVSTADGTWWWRCYNPTCPTTYYDPETGRFE